MNKPSHKHKSTRKTRKESNPSLAPQGINARNWYYEERNFIDVYHEELDDDGHYKRTVNFKIPLHKLITTIRRIRPEALK